MPASRAKWLRNDDNEPIVIEAEFDGVTMYVPKDRGNRHYAEILSQVDNEGFVIENPDPEPIIVPTEVPKLALVRAMRTIGLDGARVAGVPQSAWGTVRAMLDQAPTETQEDWDMVTRVTRDDPIMQTFTMALPWPEGTDSEAVLDKLYRIADAIDRRLPKQEVDALIDGPV